MKKTFAGFLAVALLVMIGCNAAADAQTFSKIIGGVIAIAQSEEPALPPADAAVLTPWVNLAQNLQGQLNTCISSAVSAGSKSASFVACFNTFAAGVASPAELAALHVLSPTSQGKVQLYVTAIIVGVNAALIAFKGTAVPSPVIPGNVPATATQLRQEFPQIAAAYGY